MRRFRSYAIVTFGIIALLAAGSCGEPEIVDVNRDNIDDGTSTTTVIAPSNPLGTVTGLILDAATGQPISQDENVFVRLVAGVKDEEVTIDDGSGRFRFEDVPAGVGIALSVTCDGFTNAFAETVLDAEVGNFPADNAHVFVGPIELIELEGSLGALVIGPDGRPVARTAVYLDADFAFFVDGVVQGRFHAAVQTDDNGLATFDQIPSAALMTARIGARQFIFTVPPADTDNNGEPDFAGATATITVADAALRAAPVVIVVGYPTGSNPLHVVASNVADLVNQDGSVPAPVPMPSVLPKGGNITIAFNQPVDPGSFLLRLVGEEGGEPLGVAPSWSGYGNIVEIPLPEAVQAGQEYNAFVEARPLEVGQGSAYRGAVAFFIQVASDEAPEGRVLTFYHEEVNQNGQIDSGDYVWFHLSVPVGARLDDGSAATAGDMLPVRVQAVGVDVNNSGLPPGGADHPFEFGYQGSGLPPSADVVEVVPQGGQYVGSGYSTRLRLALPSGVVLQDGNSVTFAFTFNDPIGATATQRLRVSTPAGVLPAPPNKSDILSIDPRARDGG